MDVSPQVEAIKENANKIANLIKGNLTTIANDLKHVKLLTDQDYDEIVSTPGIPQLQRANTLVQHVIPQVEIDPAQYEVFRGVLEKHLNPDVLRKILPKLDGESVLFCSICSYSGVLRTRSGMVPHYDTQQGGVTPIDSIVTAATALSQRSTVKPVE